MTRRFDLLFFTFWALAGGLGFAADDQGRGDRKLERETFSFVNEYRASEHLSPFAWSEEVARIARSHSRDMALMIVDFGHAGFGDRMNLLRTEFIGMHSGGENVLMTTDPANVAHQAVSLWLNSPRHLHNIRSNFNVSGLGVWISPAGEYYFTQIFLRAAESPDDGGG
jgi:uncharacterized protein YkwD